MSTKALSRCLYYRGPTSCATPCIRDDARLATSGWQDNTGMKGGSWEREKQIKEGWDWLEGGEKQVCRDGKLCIDEQLSSSLDVWTCGVFARTRWRILSADAHTRMEIDRSSSLNLNCAFLPPSLLLQSLFLLDASKLLQHLQSADYKHIMIGLRGMEGGALLKKKKKKAPKDEPSPNFPAFCLRKDLKNTLLLQRSPFHWHLICFHVWVRDPGWCVCKVLPPRCLRSA